MIRFHRSLTLSIGLGVLLMACQGSEIVRPIDQLDTTADTSTLDADGDVSGDTTTVESSLRWWFVTQDGVQTKCVGETTCVLLREDELAVEVATPGFQVEVQVEMYGVAPGTDVSLVIDGNVAGQGVATAGGGDTTGVRFTSITIPADGQVFVTVSATDLAGSDLSETKQVTTAFAPCDIAVSATLATGTTCPALSTQEGTLGFAVTVSHAGGLCDGATLSHTWGGVTTDLPEVALDASGEATFFIALGTDATVDGDVTVTARLHHATLEEIGSETTLAWWVDNTPPLVAITAPAVDTVITPVDDLDEAADGVQITVTGTVDDADTELALFVDGAAAGTLVGPDAGGFVFNDVTLSADKQTEFRVTAVDACGNTGEGTVSVAVLVSPALVTITAPLDGATLLAVSDTVPATPLVLDTTFTVVAESAADGDAVVVVCDLDGVEVGRVAVDGAALPAGGVFTVPVQLRATEAAETLVCRALLESAVNPGTSSDVAVVVALPAPSLQQFTAPLPGACLTAATVTVTGTATGLDGRNVAVSFRNAAGAQSLTGSVGPVAAANYSGEVALTGLANGAYTLSVDATDARGNVVSATQTAPSVAIVRDTTAPVVTLQAPAATLTPATNPAHVDQDLVADGYQTTVELKLADTNVTGSELCLHVGGADLGCKVASATGLASWTGVTLQPGQNTLLATGTDGCGIPSAQLSSVVTLVTTSPVVVIESPAQDTLVATATATLVARATAASGGAPIVGATASLFVNGDPVTATAADGGDGTYTFANVALVAGANVFTVQVDAAGVLGTSGPRTITRKAVTPTIALTAPPAGTLNLASADCAAGTVDCVVTATAATTNAEDGSAAHLDVDCAGTTSAFDTTVAAGAASFAGVTLTDATTCTLTPSVTDAVAQSATGAAVVVHVDRVAPVVAITLPASSQVVYTEDTDPVTPNIQQPLQATVSGVEAGRVVTATLVYTGLGGATSTTTLTHTVTVDTPDGGSYAAAFEDAVGAGTVTLLAGTYEIRVTVSDLAGNPAVAADKTVYVQTEDASVRITFPDFIGDAACSVAVPCASGRLCNPVDSRCYDAWSIAESHDIFTATNGLLTDTQNLRICSNHPSLASTDAATCVTDRGDGQVFRELVRTDTAGGVSATAIEAVVPDGFQTVVAEVLPVAGGAWQSSDAPANAASERSRRLYVDLVRPAIASLTSPSDTQEPFGVLNAAEQSAPTGKFSLAFDVSEAGTAQVYVNGSLVATEVVPAGVTSLVAQLASGVNTIYVVVTDVVGNPSLVPPAPGVVLYTPTVDLIGPSLSFSSPATATLKAGDDLDVRLSSSAEGRTVTLFDAGTELATATVMAGIALFAHATAGVLTDGPHTLTAMVTDSAGNPATAATTPATIVVDTQPPSGVLHAPADGSILTDADDADAAPGFQIAASFATADGAVSWNLWIASNCDAAFNVCDAPQLKASGAVTNAGGDEPPRIQTVDLPAPTTRKRLILETVDVAGNTATTSVRLTFAITQCNISFADLPSSGWYNATYCAGGGSCATANVTVTARLVGACAGVTEVRLLDGATQLGTAVPVTGEAAFIVTLNDGASLSLEAKAFKLLVEAASTGAQPVQVDLTPPVVAFVAAVVEGFATAGAGQTVTWNADTDLAPLVAGMQFNARVQVADAHLAGGRITTLTATAGAGAVALAPSNGALPIDMVGPSPFVRDLVGLTLADLSTHTVAVTAQDAAGNVGSSSFVATADVTRPDPVPITLTQVVSKRRVSTRVFFTAVGDNAMTGGPVASYDLRYSRSPITDDNFAAACDFKGLYVIGVVPAPDVPGTTLRGQLGGPDKRPFEDPCKLDITFEDGVSAPTDPAWFIAVRAKDAAGNVSLLGPTSVYVQTRAEIQLEIGRIKFSNDVGSAFAGSASFLPLRGRVVGDINGDGRQDIVTGSEQVQKFCVLYGHNLAKEEVLTTASGANHDCLLDATSLFPGEIVRSIASSVRRLNDVNGDGIADFGVTGRFGDTANNFTGEAFFLVYLGRTGGPVLTAPEVVIRGIQHLNGTSPYVGACGVGDFDGADAGGGLADDIGIGEAAYNRVHVVPGRRSWTPGQARVTINLGFDVDRVPANGEPDDSAVRIANGVFSVYGPTFALNTALFGLQCGGAGDVLPTPAGGGTGAKDDLIIYQSGSSDARLFVLPGREYAAGTIVNVSQNIGEAGFPTAEDSISLRLRQESTGIKDGFGSSFLARVDVTGDTIPDIVAGCRKRSNDFSGGDGKSVYIFSGAKFAANVGTDMRVNIGTNPKVELSWTGTNGYVLDLSVNSELGSIGTAGNFDAWFSGSPPVPSNDLVVGSSGADRVELRVSHKFGSVIDYGQFPVEDAEFENIYSTGGTFTIGLWVEGGVDLTGDGLLDIATGSAQGEIIIVR